MPALSRVSEPVHRAARFARRARRAVPGVARDVRHVRANRRERDRLRAEVGDLRAQARGLLADIGLLRTQAEAAEAARRDLETENADVWARLTPYLRGWPPGHFYSPIPDLEEVRRRDAAIFAPPPPVLPDVPLRAEGQVALFRRLARFYADQPFTEEHAEGRRYGFDNPYFSYGEALVYHALLREVRPARVVEVGSGHSSAVLLDTNELFLGGATACTFVEPYPERLEALLRSGDRVRVLRAPVQEVDPAVFAALEPGDVLFVDSTHVAKVGSDVLHLLFRVLPGLPTGVWIHFHDVHYPFEYPREWVLAGRAWNEAYLLRALLGAGSRYEIAFFGSYFARFHSDELERGMPLAARNPGSSLWLRTAEGP